MLVDISDKNTKFCCALFQDGYMIVNNTWIKGKIDENNFQVYYPPKNATNLVSKALSKKIILGWKFMNAEIKCAHDTLLDARTHVKNLSGSESETEDAIARTSDSNFVDLENAARIACGINGPDNAEMTETTANEGNTAYSASTNNIDDYDRILNAEIDSAEDIDGVKEILKKLVHRISLIERTPPILNGCDKCGCDNKNTPFDKVSTVEGFANFTTKLANDGGFAKSVIERWKMLRVPSNSHQQPQNAKVYAILMDLFDKDFLSNNVLWGRMRSSGPVDDSKVYLKIYDDFVDTVKEALDIKISPATTCALGKVFKTNLRNKLKRDMKMEQEKSNEEVGNKAKKNKTN